MAKKKDNSHFHHHGPPVTRRDFLSRGLMSISTVAMAPSVLGLASLASSKARAESCAPSGWAPGAIPYLVFDLPGGAALQGNFLVGGKGGAEDLLPSYSDLGWDPRAAGAIDKRFGLPMAANASKIFQGIIEKASPEAQANLKMASICHQSQADSSLNANSALLLVTRAGAFGSQFAAGLGTTNSFSGSNTSGPYADPAIKPLHITRYEDLAGALAFGNAFSQGAGYQISDKLLGSVMKAITSMSAEQSAKLASMNLGDQFKTLFNCGLQKNVTLTAPSSVNLDPRKSPEMCAAFGITTNSNSGDLNVVMATIVYNALKGNTGPGAIAGFGGGGYDYHSNDHVSADNADLAAGRAIGMAVEAAYRLNQAFMFQIVSDGGVRGPGGGSRDWNGDTNDSMTIIGYYNPKGVSFRSQVVQLGNYTAGQGADGSTDLGGSTARVGFAVLANYLNAIGKFGDFRKYVNESELPTPGGGLDSFLLFA
ncbi:MAG: hypothetical protein ACJ763_03215 [Bdellovibrionia bacterium]